VALKPDALRAFAVLDKAVFKFVAREPGDVTIAAAIASAHAIAPSRVYIMPEGVGVETLNARARDLAPAIIAHGFNFTPRLHVELFGARRGV
jgi:hypothetical protein